MTIRRLILAFCIATAIASTQTTVHADLVDVTDGTSTFTWDPDNGTNTLTTSFDPNISFSFTPLLRYRRPAGSPPAGGAITTIDMADKATGSDRLTNSVNNSGSTATAHADVSFSDPFLGIQDLFDVDFSFSIGSTPFGDPDLLYSITVTNVSGMSITDVELFQYYDWDLITNQNSGEDSSMGGFTGFMQRVSPADGDPDTMAMFHGTDNLENWEVDDWDNIITKLSAPTHGSLSNSGTPYAVADMTAAFGWNLGTMNAGDSFTVNLLIRGIPEPGSTLLLLGLGGIWLARHRRAA